MFMFCSRQFCFSIPRKQFIELPRFRHSLKNIILHHATWQQQRLRLPVQKTVLRAFRSSTRQEQLKPTVPESHLNGGPVSKLNIVKAMIFTGTFTTGCFMAATILEYENARKNVLERMRQSKLSWFTRKSSADVKSKWDEIKRELQRYYDQLSAGDKIFAPICTINLLVFGLWRVPSMRNAMMKYFVSNPASRVVCWPMFLSTFSHYSGFHIFANMYVLHSFANVAVLSLGKEQFLAVYLSAGVIASLASILYKAAISQAGLSIGASGAIMAILAFVCVQYPDTQLSILFLPTLTFSASAAIKVIMGLDFAGVLLGWKFFDHAAHLGGALFGLLWAYYGIELWSQRLPFLRFYHDLRKTKP